MNDLHLVARYLFPEAEVERLCEVVQDPDGTLAYGSWNLPGTPPSPEKVAELLDAARARYVQRVDLKDTEAMLDERVNLYTRAVAVGQLTEATDIQAEITEIILPYIKELRDAPNPA